MSVPRVLSIASSDSGGAAGIQADIKAFARCGAHGMTAIVALTAQNTLGVTAIHELPPAFVRAQIDAVLDDIGADAAKTGMLFSAPLIEAVAEALAPRNLPLVVDPVMVASSGSRLLREDAVETLVTRLFPLATVITPNLPEAQALSRTVTEDRAKLAERLAAMGAAAVLITGGHGTDPVDHLFDGSAHLPIPVARHRVAATHGAGCTHSAALAAGLAAGLPLAEAARQATDVASDAVAHGLATLGGGDGPVHALHRELTRRLTASGRTGTHHPRVHQLPPGHRQRRIIRRRGRRGDAVLLDLLGSRQGAAAPRLTRHAVLQWIDMCGGEEFGEIVGGVPSRRQRAWPRPCTRRTRASAPALPHLKPLRMDVLGHGLPERELAYLTNPKTGTRSDVRNRTNNSARPLPRRPPTSLARQTAVRGWCHRQLRVTVGGRPGCP